MNKNIVAVMSHKYTTGDTKVVAFVLDGSPEDHELYRESLSQAMKVDKKTKIASPDEGKRTVAEHVFEDRYKKFPELVGNPMYYFIDEGKTLVPAIAEIQFSATEGAAPFLNLDLRDDELKLAKLVGESPKDALTAYVEKLEKARYSAKGSKKTSPKSEDPLDGL